MRRREIRVIKTAMSFQAHGKTKRHCGKGKTVQPDVRPFQRTKQSEETLRGTGKPGKEALQEEEFWLNDTTLA